MDIVNNTAYLNSSRPELQYSQIYTYSSKDVRIMNNILVAPVADVAAGEKPEPVNRLGGKNTDVVFSHNLYFAGNIEPTMGEGDQIGDPQFINPSLDFKATNFHLKPGSPALGTSKIESFVPLIDQSGKVRGTRPNLGAY